MTTMTKNETVRGTKQSMAGTMKAAVIQGFGGPDVLELIEVPVVEPQPGHLLIKVNAAGLNRFDHSIRQGEIAPELPWPHILGADAAGEVAAIGPGVTGFEIGDVVIPMPGYPLDEDEWGIRPAGTAASFTLPGLGRPGTYAQYIEFPAEFTVRDHTGLSPELVATLPMVLATAVRSVKTVGGVKSGDTVLVHAGAGGAGSMQLQVAKALSARVATTVRSQEDADFARALGADFVIDTSTDDFVARVKEWTDGQGVDVVIDSLGGNVLPKSIEAARPLGTIVVFGFAAGTETTFDVTSLFFTQKRLLGSMASDKEDLEYGLELVAAGHIKPILDRALPLSEAAEAHRLIADNEITGSLVLLPWA